MKITLDLEQAENTKSTVKSQFFKGIDRKYRIVQTRIE